MYYRLNNFHTAMNLSRQHPVYVGDVGVSNLMNLWMGAALTDRMEILNDLETNEPEMAYSWMRFPVAPSGIPDETMWKSTTGFLFVVDVVAAAGTNGLWVGRTLRNSLIRRGIAEPGEEVSFHSYRTDRWGSFIARDHP